MYVSTQVDQGIGTASADVFGRELCEEIGIPTFIGTRLGLWYEPVIDGDSFTAVVECPGAPPSLGNDLDVLHGSCDQCPRGSYDDDLDGSTECITCPQGQYSHEPGTAGSCTQCPLGTLSLEGAMAASQCNMQCDVNGKVHRYVRLPLPTPRYHSTPVRLLARRLDGDAHSVRGPRWRFA